MKKKRLKLTVKVSFCAFASLLLVLSSSILLAQTPDYVLTVDANSNCILLDSFAAKTTIPSGTYSVTSSGNAWMCNPSDPECYFDNVFVTYPFNNPFFFILNIAVGGNWPGNPDETTLFPQTMEIDYIRVFQQG